MISKIENHSMVYKSNKHQIYPRTSKPASENWKWSPLILSSFSKSWTTVSRECSFTILADPNTSRLSFIFKYLRLSSCSPITFTQTESGSTCPLCPFSLSTKPQAKLFTSFSKYLVTILPESRLICWDYSFLNMLWSANVKCGNSLLDSTVDGKSLKNRTDWKLLPKNSTEMAHRENHCKSKVSWLKLLFKVFQLVLWKCLLFL